MGENYLSRFVDYIFSIKKENFYLILVFLVGFILRALMAIRRKFSGDEAVHGVHAIGFIGSGKLQIMDQSAVWFWLTDFFMKIFSVNVFGIRFMSILFGSISIIVIYLIAKELFGKKTGLIVAGLSAISTYQLEFMEAGMDTSMTFFVLLSVYFFILSTKEDNKLYFYLIWVSIGIAIMIKSIAALFFIALFICSLFYHWKKLKSYNLKTYFKVVILIFILLLPIFTFNYLLYKDKGILDLQFARFTRISVDTYSSISSTIESFSLKTLLFSPGHQKPGYLVSLGYFYLFETLIVLLFGLLGAIYFFKTKKQFRILIATTFLIPFLFLSGTSLLPNHFVFMSYYLCLFAGLGIKESSNYVKKHRHKKLFFLIIFLIVIISTYSFIVNKSVSQGLFGGKNELGLVVDYKEENIKQNALVITDGRIYTGRVVFMFWDRNYLLAGDFLQLVNNIDQVPGQVVSTEVYFIECVIDDCGWGGGQVAGEFNQSMEGIASEFNKIGTLEKKVDDIYGNHHFNIYKANIDVKTGFFDVSRSNKNWFYYPVNYEPKSQIFDNYETNGFLDIFLDQVAHLILYLEVLVAIIFALMTFYLLFKEGGI